MKSSGIDIEAILNAFGYLRSDGNWVTPADADQRLAHYYRLAQRVGEDIGNGAEVIGSYVYQTSLRNDLTPPRPAVFVARAESDQDAREIHRRIWCLGDCPFVIVVTPNLVRIYSGFDYSRNEPTRAVILNEPVESVLGRQLPKSVQPFHADSINRGDIWQSQAKYLGSDTRVDYQLLTSLKNLSRILHVQFGLTPQVGHALTGKYIYFRYLRDRKILDDGWLAEREIDPTTVFGRKATAEGFESLASELQLRFNGDIFPLPSGDDRRWRTNGAIPFLARIFDGDMPDGQLALDFDIYDFSYIPVELLSSIYEQFLKSEGRGADDGVVYTPEALADYVLSELETVRPLGDGHTVLDPCCGSGVFLVLAYRRMIERMLRQRQGRPTPNDLKQLLQQSVFGIEKDLEACHITAFSLLLTLLSHLEPPDLKANDSFLFPTLVGENIFRSDFFDDSCTLFKKGKQFDWVAGNPPWSRADEKNTDHALALAWMRDAEKVNREVGDRRLDEAFTWRAGELLRDGGFAGLLIKATSLVNSSSSQFRRGFFSTHEVRRVTNFSNLRYILFIGPEGQRAKAPCACLVYRNATTQDVKKPIRHFGPLVATQLQLRVRTGVRPIRRRAWTIALYESDIQEIDHVAAEADEPYLWKAALWGTHQDRRALRRIRALLPSTVGAFTNRPGWLVSSGVKIYRGDDSAEDTGTFVPEPRLERQSLLGKKPLARLFVRQDDLTTISKEQAYISCTGGDQGLGLTEAPHLVITTEHATYSADNFVIPSPRIGIKAPESEARELKALALYLNSSIGRYAHFFQNAPWGIYVHTANKDTVLQIPFAQLTPDQTRYLAEEYDRLTAREQAFFAESAPLVGERLDLQPEIDNVVETALYIPGSVGRIAREFIKVRYELLEGKSGRTASSPPSNEVLRQYAEALREILDDFVRRKHRITIHAGNEVVLADIEVTSDEETIPVILSHQQSAFARNILAAVAGQHSQWAYIQRSVRIYSGHRVSIIKMARLLDWTSVQATQDAADLIAEVLNQTGSSKQ